MNIYSVSCYQNKVLKNADAVPEGLRSKLANLIKEAYESNDKLTKVATTLAAISDGVVGARYAIEHVVPATKDLRCVLDKLEENVDRKDWPYPSYEQLLLSRNSRSEIIIKE